MPFLFWDASALAKRFVTEIGQETADALFDAIPGLQHGSTAWGYAETYAILLRRMNGKMLTEPDFTVAASMLQAQVAESESFVLLAIHPNAPFDSLALIRKHNLNSTDAILLKTLLDFSRSPEAPICVMVSADKRLLRAAEAEGLPTLNPETASIDDATAQIAALG